MDKRDINLYKTGPEFSQSELRFIRRFKIFSIITACLFVGISVAIAIIYFSATIQYNQLDEERGVLTRSLDKEAKKRLLIANIKQRVPLIQSTVDSQLPWDQIIDILNQLAVPPFLKTVSIDTAHQIKVSASGTSLDEINHLVSTAISLENDKKIHLSEINSLQIDKDGKLSFDFSFIPTL